jgi:release factor glutamine methyltransferase
VSEASCAVTDPVERRLAAAGCVYAAEEAGVLRSAARDDRHLDALAARRASGVPLEQVVGWAELAGHRVEVAPGVFVPRRRTELLVEVARPRVRAGGVLVELCCGSGAVSAVLAAEAAAAGVPLDLHAADLSPAALACAAGNLGSVGGHVYRGDLDAALPDHLHGRVDLLLASPPYVPTAAVALLPREAREHEPVEALDGGPDGTDVLRRIVACAPAWLRTGGRLLLETGEEQGDPVARACRSRGMPARVHRCEERGATVVEALRA